eukprot:7228980-Prymnesium_polylepis.1
MGKLRSRFPESANPALRLLPAFNPGQFSGFRVSLTTVKNDFRSIELYTAHLPTVADGIDAQHKHAPRRAPRPGFCAFRRSFGSPPLCPPPPPVAVLSSEHHRISSHEC